LVAVGFIIAMTLGKFAPVKPNVSGGANNPSLISRVTANQ
jgi:hypothetical protein